MGRCIIMGAGDFFGFDIKIEEDDYIIAADGGYDSLIKAGVKPDFVIGDFHSRNGLVPELENVKTLPVKKDVTDMDAASMIGWGRGFREFHIFGGTGGSRFSHTMANIQLMSGLVIKGAKVFLHGEKNISTVIFNDSIEFESDKKGYISVFSLSDRSLMVNIEGLKYELKDGILENSFALGVSNEFIGKKSRISVENGLLLLVMEKIIPAEQ